MPTVVGILALQGAFAKHKKVLTELDTSSTLVRTLEDLSGIKALIIPGGESTTMGKLLVNFNLIEPIRERIRNGMAVFGTCAGMILLAEYVADYNQPLLKCMDIRVERNAYGRQIESFETDISIQKIDSKPFRGVFIRAPRIISSGKSVEVLADFEGSPVIVRENNILAASFHPELTDDPRIHQYFLSMI